MSFSPNIKLLFFFSMSTLLLHPAEPNKKRSNEGIFTADEIESERKYRAKMIRTLEEPFFMTGIIEHPWTPNKFPWCEGSHHGINTYITVKNGKFSGLTPVKIKHNNNTETRILAPLHRAAAIENSCEKNFQKASIRYFTNKIDLEKHYAIEHEQSKNRAQGRVEALMESQYWSYWHLLFKKGDHAREVLSKFITVPEIIDCISSYIPTAYGYKTVLNIHLITPDEAPYAYTDEGIPLIDYRCLKNPPVCFPKSYIEYKYSMTSRVDWDHVKKFIFRATHHTLWLWFLKQLGTRPLERILSFAKITTHLDKEGCLAAYRLLYHSYNDSEEVAPLTQHFSYLEEELSDKYCGLHEKITRRNYRIAQKAEENSYRNARYKIISDANTELIAASSLGLSGRQTNGNQLSIEYDNENTRHYHRVLEEDQHG